MNFETCDGEVKIHLDLTEEKKDIIAEKIIQYCVKNECFDGEVLYQSDDCIIDAPSVLGDIIDNVMCFERVD